MESRKNGPEWPFFCYSRMTAFAAECLTGALAFFPASLYGFETRITFTNDIDSPVPAYQLTVGMPFLC